MTGLFYFHEGDRTKGSLRERISPMLRGSTRGGWPKSNRPSPQPLSLEGRGKKGEGDLGGVRN